MSIIEPEVRSLDPCFMNISYHTINTIIITPTLKRTKQRHRKSLPSANSQVTSQSHRARKSQKSPTSAFGTLVATMEASPLRRMLPWMFFPADHPIIQANPSMITKNCSEVRSCLHLDSFIKDLHNSRGTRWSIPRQTE